MKRYRIVPEKKDAFSQLAAGMLLSPEDMEELAGATLLHIEVTPETNTWELLLRTIDVIDDDLLRRLALHVKETTGYSAVFYQAPINLGEAVAKSWHLLLQAVSRTAPLAAHILTGAKIMADGVRLTIGVGGFVAHQLLEEKNVADCLIEAIRQKLGVDVSVTFEITDSQAVSGIDADQALYRSEEFKKAVTAAKEIPLGTGGESEGGSFGGSYGGYSGEGSDGARRSSRRKPVAPEEGCLLGKRITGEPVAIGDIVGEMKNVVVCGIIDNITGREFAKTNILTFDIVDETNGISCKMFVKDKDEYERLKGVLKANSRVRIRGPVEFDSFLSDHVIKPFDIMEEKQAKREDKAEVKRVELHAHTQMSTLDAVVSVNDLIDTAARWGWPAVAITDHGVVQGFPAAMKRVIDKKLSIKVIYGMEGYLTGEDYHQKHANHIILLAKNTIGLRNLYRLVSLSHLRFFHRQPRLPKAILSEFREGLIIGSACEAGELIRAIVDGRSDEELLEIASFYDYLEIQPIHNNDFMKLKESFPDINTDEDLININLKVAELAKKQGKMLVATCDTHFLNPEDSIYRAIIMAGNGFEDASRQPPLFLRTTEEMLAEFSYLPEDEAYAAVVENPRAIAESIDRIKPIPDEDVLYSPVIPGADEEITEMSYRRAHEMYGENLPQIVQARIDQELKPIIGHGFAVLYLIAQRLVKKSNLDGYLVGSRGSVGSSFIATLTDITEVNPLPPHWRCPNCKHSHFITDGSYGCGYDLPDKECPICGTPMIKDGHDIPFAVFLGFDGDKVPDIDLNFASEYKCTAQKYTEELFGKDNVYNAGEISGVQEKTAYGYAMHYFEDQGQKKRPAFIDHIKKGCLGTKRTTGQHPAGIMVVPRDMDIHFFTPVQHPADKKESGIYTTHFDYHSISSRLVKLDILGHDDPTVIKMLENITHRDPRTIPFDDPATLSLFNSTKAIGLDPEELGSNSATFGIPEFRTGFTRQMIDDTNPSCFSDLVRISGFSHGTDVWLGNAQDLIRAGTCTVSNAISARDDIMMYLIHSGIDPLLSFKTMEKVRKGKGIDPEVVEKLRKGGIPEWYIDACQKIKYLFPRAHATAYVMMAYRIAFCKVHYPLAFYAAYFSIRADAFDLAIVAGGKDRVKQELDALYAIDKPDQKQKDLLIVLQLAWEMYLRGFSVEQVSLYESDADRFILRDKSLLPPFSAIGGFGLVAAKNLVASRANGEFTSVSDIKRRSGISKTCVEKLREFGALEGLPETDQMELFG